MTATGATGYQWFSNTTQTNTGGTSLGSAYGAQSPTYTPPPTVTAGTLYYYCVVLGDCTPSATSNASGAIVVNDLPAIYSVTGTGTYCSATGGNVGLTNSETGVNYQLFRGATPLGTLPGTGLALDFGAQTIAGTYTVVATNTTTNCTSTMTGSAVITIDTPPAQPGVITGPATICENTTKAYSIVAVGGATGYTWSYSGTGATINGTGTNITIDFATGATSGTLSVTADNSCGSSAPQTLAISVNSTLPASVSIASDDADNIICAGTSVTFTATPTNGGVTPSYQWQLNGGNVGANSPVYTTATLNDGDLVTVVLTSSLTCATGSPATSNSITMTVNPLPVATFSYTGTPYCQNVANPSPTFSGGGVAGTFSSTGGLVFVSTSTGQVNLSASTPGTYTVTNTIAAAGGCAQVTANSSITITPDNTITLTSAGGTDAQTKCINTAITNITYSTTGATGATISGLPTGVTGNWAANTVTISGTPSTTVGSPFTYTITLTGGCGTITKTGTITVTANNTITLTSAAGTNNTNKMYQYCND